jgi:hypothetical protein
LLHQQREARILRISFSPSTLFLKKLKKYSGTEGTTLKIRNLQAASDFIYHKNRKNQNQPQNLRLHRTGLVLLTAAPRRLTLLLTATTNRLMPTLPLRAIFCRESRFPGIPRRRLITDPITRGGLYLQFIQLIPLSIRTITIRNRQKLAHPSPRIKRRSLLNRR